MRKQFKNTALSLAEKDPRVIVALGDISVFLFEEFKQKYPNRFFNMGICENTLISVAAGLSSQGFFPFIHTICPFITERCMEQIKLDMCYNQFGGNIVSCGASFDYAWDGGTHQCYTDLAILRMLPNMEVIQPGSIKEADVLLRSQYNNNKPTYFRLSEYSHQVELPHIEFGKGIVLKDCGSDVTIITAGPILGNVLEACQNLQVNLLYFHTIKPFDYDLLDRFKDTQILVVHDAYGLHEAVCAMPNLRVQYHGLQDLFSPCYGTIHDIRKSFGLDPQSIYQAIIQYREDHSYVK
ncbi:MAG: transketolase, C-terminal section [Chlamydiales bacterium]|jgi:transketolase|nr:transketolase, C-terminal section [Chlamydiales bacterium]